MPATLDPPVGPDDHRLGRDDAPYDLVIYGDFECPFCQAAHSVVARVRDRMGDELRHVFRHFPLDPVHPLARGAAEAAEAAAAQGAFWDMHDKLFTARGHLERSDLERYADELGLRMDFFRDDLDTHAHADRVERDVRSGEASGVAQTPVFFTNGTIHAGAFDARSLIDALRGT